MQFKQVRQALLCGTIHWQCMSCPTLVHPLHLRGDLFVFHFANSQCVLANSCMQTRTHTIHTVYNTDKTHRQEWVEEVELHENAKILWECQNPARFVNPCGACLLVPYTPVMRTPNCQYTPTFLPNLAVLFCITWIFFLNVLYVKTNIMLSLAVLNLIICNAWFDC